MFVRFQSDWILHYRNVCVYGGLNSSKTISQICFKLRLMSFVQLSCADSFLICLVFDVVCVCCIENDKLQNKITIKKNWLNAKRLRRIHPHNHVHTRVDKNRSHVHSILDAQSSNTIHIKHMRFVLSIACWNSRSWLSFVFVWLGAMCQENKIGAIRFYF